MKRSIETFDHISDNFRIADYPCCKFFLPVNEGSGNTLTDMVNGVVCDYADGFGAGGASTLAWSGNKVLRGSGTGKTGVAQDATAQMPDLGDNDFIAFVVSDATGTVDNFLFGGGDIGEPGVQLASLVADINGVDDGAGGADSMTTGLLDANTKAVAIYSDRANSKFHLVEHDSVAAAELENIAIVNAVGSLDLSVASDNGFGMAAANTCYGAAMFAFTEIPDQAEILQAMLWMSAQWRLGNKVIYPGWINKT